MASLGWPVGPVGRRFRRELFGMGRDAGHIAPSDKEEHTSMDYTFPEEISITHLPPPSRSGLAPGTAT